MDKQVAKQIEAAWNPIYRFFNRTNHANMHQLDEIVRKEMRTIGGKGSKLKAQALVLDWLTYGFFKPDMPISSLGQTRVTSMVAKVMGADVAAFYSKREAHKELDFVAMFEAARTAVRESGLLYK